MYINIINVHMLFQDILAIVKSIGEPTRNPGIQIFKFPSLIYLLLHNERMSNQNHTGLGKH